MQAHLLFRNQDFHVPGVVAWNGDTLWQDLELGIIVSAMAQGDSFLAQVARQVLLSQPVDVDTIVYRQAILQDVLANSTGVREFYTIANAALDTVRKERALFFRTPSAVLATAIRVMGLLVDVLRNLRQVAETYESGFRSEGLRTLCAMLRQELADDYLSEVRYHLKELQFPAGVSLSTRVGEGNKAAGYVLKAAPPKARGWRSWIPSRERSHLSFSVHPRDEAGHRYLSELVSQGINQTANALAQSCDHVMAFLSALKAETGFYIGCLNLYNTLAERGYAITFPEPLEVDHRCWQGRGIYDMCLALVQAEPVVPNDLDADDRILLVVTGANRGGKSTFLRSLGVCQLLMHSGMFVPAETYRANVCDGIFTHFRREEDTELRHGKLGEELSRLRDIVDHLGSHGLILLNESFASTNEWEGSEIGRQAITALVESGIKVALVTHLYELAEGLRQSPLGAVCLRAERSEARHRSFKLIPGPPLSTSFGEDLYEKIFGAV
jgi:DNA mismatch repair ATPase MutS